jgi:DNA mismatch endonuclease, patch repair protein
MVDILTPEQRRNAMRSVRSRNTTPELLIRKFLHRSGLRYRIHRGDLPGTPDITFLALRKIINVNGCFWHGHSCSKGRLPKTRSTFWAAKIKRNKERDANVEISLAALGWKVLVVWECELKDFRKVESRLRKFLGAHRFKRRRTSGVRH